MKKKCMAVALLFCILTSSVPVEAQSNSASDVSIVQEIVTESTQQMEKLEEDGREDVMLQVETTVKGAEDSLQSGDFEYGILEDGTMEIQKYVGSDTSVTIPDMIDGKSVTSIGNSAFRGCSSLNTIIIPEGVINIDKYAFCGCSNLSTIIMPDRMTSIGEYAFNGCSGLKDFIIPEGVTSIGEYAFYSCNNLKIIMIPDTVTSIPFNAFSFCYKLEDIVYAGTEDNWIRLGIASQFSSNTVIHYNSFMTPENITEDGFKYYTISDSAIITGYAGTKTQIVIPDVINGKKVTSIGGDAFSEYKSLNSITIPEGVTRIGDSAFYRCSNLEALIIPKGVISIGRDAFRQCSSLSIVAIPEGVTSIKEDAFAFCSSLKIIMIPDTVISIASDALEGCYKLKDIVYTGTEEDWIKLSINSMPNSNVTIYYNSFMTPECVTEDGFKYYTLNSNLIITGYIGTKIEVLIPDIISGEGVTSIGEDAFRGCSSLSVVTIPEGVTSIGDAAFSGCDNLNTINIPESVTSIGEGAFRGCSSLSGIIIPEGVTSIGEFTFSECSSLKIIMIPDTVTSIASNAFDYCSTLKEIVYTGTEANWIKLGIASQLSPQTVIHYNSFMTSENITEDGFKYYILNDSVIINGYIGTKTKVVIPNLIEGKEVKSIGDSAFYKRDELNSITIPESVTSIGDLALTTFSTLTIYCAKGSYAEEYATQNGINVISDSSEKKVQNITADNQTKTFGDASFFINAETDGDSSLKYQSSNSSVATVNSSGKVTILSVGIAKIIITAPETDSYQAAEKEILITVLEKENNTESKEETETPSNTEVQDDTEAPNHTEMPGGTEKKEDTEQPDKTETIKKSQTITANDQTKMFGDVAFFLNAWTDGDASLKYQSSDPSVATVNTSGRVTLLSVGTTIITITAPETDSYQAAEKEILITVLEKENNTESKEETEKPSNTEKPDNTEQPDETEKPDNTQKPGDTERPKDKQTITASDLVKTVGDPAFLLDAETNGDGTLSFYSHQPEVLTVNDSGMAEIISAGTAQISVRASATEFWEAAEATVTVTVIPEDYTPIYDIADLYAIRNNPEGNYILVNDIDMSVATAKGGDYDCGTGWDSIETFRGTLDGNGHKIIGMHIFGEFNTVNYTSIGVGLFERISEATIKNLGVVECNIDVIFNVSWGNFTQTGINGVGGITGIANWGNVENCYSSGNITISKIDYDDARVMAYHSIGGLVGYVEYTEIKNCVNLCGIDCTQVDKQCTIGGICGRNAVYGRNVQYCYNIGNITGNDQCVAGGICGYSYYVNCNSCCYLKNTASQGIGSHQDDANCVSLTEAQMKNPKLFTGFDFTDTWEIDPYCSYPYPQLKNNRMVRVNSIKLASMPRKLVYSQGEALNISGGILEIVYEDDIKTSIPLTAEMVSGYDMAHIGEQTVWVRYGASYTSFDIEVNEVPVSSVTLPENISLYRGKEQQLNAVVLPANASNPSLQWNSDNPAVATVDGSGLVKAKAGGTATITASAVNGIEAKCVVSVIVPSISIQLSSASLVLKEGTSAALTVTILPLESTDTVQWASSNPAVADVYDGNVIARKAGTAVITASTGSGITADCTVTVQRAAASVPGDSESLGEELLPQTITAKDIKKTYGAKSFSLNAKASGGGKLSYSVENKKVARIDKNGKVTITGCGVTEIEIYAEANSVYDEAEETITLTVAPKKLTLTSAKSQKSKSVTVKWKKDTKASGYIIEYSTDKKFRKGVKTAIVSKNKTTSKKITKLKAGKKYYIRACAYAAADGEKIKGAYSTIKTVKVKK